MGLAEDLQITASARPPQSMAELANDVTTRVIDEACKAVGYTDKRRRTLPVEMMIWLAIGMALFRDRSIEAVALHLHLWRGKKPPTGGALAQRRQVVGSAPVEMTFHFTAEEWAVESARAHAWRGLALFGVDGVCLRVADSPDNEKYFGRPGSPSTTPAGYPQLRMAALMTLRSHLLLGVEFGPYSTHEVTLAEALWPLLVDHSLVILDKGFIDFSLLYHLKTMGTERHVLIRARSNQQWTLVKELGEGDLLVEVELTALTRKQYPGLPRTMTLRAIRYQRRGFSVQWLLTSLEDAVAYPAAEIVALYHERWDQELGHDEIKTHTLDREESLRSQSPEMVKQEVWGLCLAYNLVRRQMERVAKEQGVEPNRVSYRNALLLVQNTCLCAAMGAGSAAGLVESMNANMALLILPERRDRTYPRQIKIKSSHYKKHPGRSPKKSLN
jgi:hypothetical protein